MTGSKRCSKCKETKLNYEFARNTKTHNLSSWCKDCVSEYGRERRKKLKKLSVKK